MIVTGFEQRVKIQQVINNQLPEFILDESPKAAEFLKQYYISQEYQGGPIDIAENLDQYLKFDKLTPEIIVGITSLSTNITSTSDVIIVTSTKGFPSEYGLFKIDDEIITYTGLTTNTFTGCIRGFSGITSYRDPSNPEELIFSTSSSAIHAKGSAVTNLSSLFLKEFYRKLKYLFAPGFEDINFTSKLNVGNFIKEIKTFYQSKGTDESFRILFNILYNITPRVLNLEDYIIKPSQSEYVRRVVLIAELITPEANPKNLIGQELRSVDETAFGPVSEVEIVTRNNKILYKIQLFPGFDQNSLVFGKFKITQKTKLSEYAYAGATTLTVDSTVGFDTSGIIHTNSGIVTYTDKSVNQFYNCVGVNFNLPLESDVYGNQIVYGYENGDLNKKIEFIIIGSLSNIENLDNINYFNPGDRVSFGNYGENIENPSTNKTFKQTIFNSWIYNVRSRYEIKSFVNGTSSLTLYESPDVSSLRVGDYVDVVKQNSTDIVLGNAVVTTIIGNIITLDQNILNVAPNQKLSIVRQYNHTSSSSVPLEYNNIVSNVQNTYNENDEYIYVASNSLPTLNITKTKNTITKNINSVSDTNYFYDGLDQVTYNYTILSFNSPVPFITGDSVIYNCTTTNPIFGLTNGQEYFVEVLPQNNKIRLYTSRSFIPVQNYIQFQPNVEIGSHTFTLSFQIGKILSPTKSLYKFRLKENIDYENQFKTSAGPVGLLANGVEILSYKSNDYIYYGPLDSVTVVNKGFDYDVINPPTVVVADSPVGVGTTAKINLIVKGSIKDVVVDPQSVSVERVSSVTISGGNGSGAILEPILSTKYKEIPFNAQQSSINGGVNVSNETITFLEPHTLKTGDKIVYDSNGNPSLGIGVFGSSNTDQGLYLGNGSVYYPKVINDKSVQIYNSLTDLTSGINTVGFTTINTGGVHKFRFFNPIKVLSQIRVVNGGSGYENRSLPVKSSLISIIDNTVNFVNHGFNDGELVVYSTSDSPISGLSTTNNYYILKVDDNTFKLADAGLISQSPSKLNYNRRKEVNFVSAGTGYQIFSYPPIQLNIKAEYSGFIGTITATPIVRGEIVDAYLYEQGTNYGSTILNFNKTPIITIKKGSGAQLKPIIVNGSIVAVEVQTQGNYYPSGLDLIISGTGIGAKLRAVVNDGKIVSVVVINGGIGYDQNTDIRITVPGKNAQLKSSVRKLTVNNYVRFSDVQLNEYKNNLKYGIVGYSTERDGSLLFDPDPNTGHSKIIGWCRDGNPIYGPFGHNSPEDINSPIVKINSGYSLNSNNIINRPSTSNFASGFFIEDYTFTSSGHLDENNGRYCKTPEFPNGTYAYFAGINTNPTTGKLVPEFPYFIGDTYRSHVDEDFVLDQNNDLNDSILIRNTFPYRVNQKHSSNDFIPKVNDQLKQTLSITSTISGKIDSLSIVNSGDRYSIGDSIVFDERGTDGGGAAAQVSELYGKPITKLETTFENYDNVIFKWKNDNTITGVINPYHTLVDNDKIQISGISTYIKNLSGSHKINFTSQNIILTKSLNSSGITTDIYVSEIPNNIGVGNSIKIDSEVFSILNIFQDEKIIRCKRNTSPNTHLESSIVRFYPNSFDISVNTPYFESHTNDVVYFNPYISIGFGTDVGGSVSSVYPLGDSSRTLSIPTQSIYLPNHPFRNNQKVLLTRGNTEIVVRDTIDGPNMNLVGASSTTVYVINKSKDYIGIVTSVGLTTQTNGLFFITNGEDSNSTYKFESLLSSVTASVKKIKSKVSVSTSHNLIDGDYISLIVEPNLTVGVGTSGYVKVKYNSDYNKLLINPIGFNSISVDVSNNIINLKNHNLATGDKVFYSAIDNAINGSNQVEYYVYKVDIDNIKLSETYIDSLSNPPVFVSIGSSGGNYQELSKVNPQIQVVKNNNLLFDLSDTSLSGYSFDIFYDKNFNKNLVSIGNTNQFSVQKYGLAGINTNATCTINYNEDFPTKLYYTLTKNQNSIFNNLEENQYEIIFNPSVYNGSYPISGISNTSFYVSLTKVPESFYYDQLNCNTLKYTTKSLSATGPISKIDILNGGIGYKKLPRFSTISSASFGKNATIQTSSNSIGKVGSINIINDGYEYPSDKTLRPTCDINSLLVLRNFQQIVSVQVEKGGKNFVSPPTLIVINTVTREKINNGYLKPKMGTNSVSEVEVVDVPKGIDEVVHEVLTLNNSNGISVVGVTTYLNGIVECKLRTPPVTGFSIPPFSPGDYIFVEGIQKGSFTDEFGNVTSPGNGFNSADNGYNFFKVTEFINSDPAILKYDISPYTNFAGSPVQNQTVFSSIINKNNYPKFKVFQTPSVFFENELLEINGTQSDIFVKSSSNNSLKVNSTAYKIKEYDIIRGTSSGSLATIGQIFKYDGRFILESTNTNQLGWKNNTGKLNYDTQVIEDNDYYQSLSYSVQSPIEYEKFIDSVNRLIHPIGIKNFADTGITSSTKTGVASSELLLTTLDFIEEKRVDVINNFDLVYDYESLKDSSYLIRFKNKKLTDYIQCDTNRVLQIDDISNSFSNSELNKDIFLDVIEYPITNLYSKFLVQVCDTKKEQFQLSEIVMINDYDSTYTLNKNDLYSLDSLGNFSGQIGLDGNPVLRFVPNDPYNKSYQLKIYQENFDPGSRNIGAGFTDYGFIRLSAKTESLKPIIGVTTSVFKALSSQFNSVYANSIIIDTDNNKLGYYEVFGCFNGTDTNIAEFYFDSERQIGGSSGQYIGTFGLNVSNGIISLDFTNNKNNNIVIKTKVVGFGTTAAGISTIRLLANGQIPGSERTTKLESDYHYLTGIGTIKSFDSSLCSSLKSLVKVSLGSTVALHELIVVSDQLRTNIQHYPFISVGSTSGIGTFGTTMNGSQVYVNFYPDSYFSSSNILIQSFDQFIYTDFDEFNIPNPLIYGTSQETITNARYGSVNNYGKDRLDFDLNYQKTPIFQKTFSPSIPSTLNLGTGVFTINNHFFEDREKLIYAPGSTLAGIPALPLGISTAIVGGTSFIADVISGFSTVTGIGTSSGIQVNQYIIGENIPNNTQIVSIGQTYPYFIGDVVSLGSTVITGIANTNILSVGSGIFSGNNSLLGTIVQVGINSIVASTQIPVGLNRLYYTNQNYVSLTLSNVSTGTTFRKSYSTGISTTICPSTVYAIKIDENNFKLSGVSGLVGSALTFTSVGSGNAHTLEMDKKLEKCLISVNGVNQYPLSWTPLTYTLSGNIGGSIGVGVTFISLSGISSIHPLDILKVENEYLVVTNVGYGTTASGPITGLGTLPIVQVTRGSLGSSEVSHNDGSSLRLYKGSYNLVGNKIWFSQAPDGTGNNALLGETYLPRPKASFNGRVYLRKDYSTNKIYDDISYKFTGIGRTFTLYKEGQPVSDAIAGNNLVFINDIFQTPDTDNNAGNNYTTNSSSGVSSITFTSVTIPNTDTVLIVPYDVNQNQVPRGGIVVSLASTGGLGYAPLVGIPTGSLNVQIGAGGSISSVSFNPSATVGSGYRGPVSIGITDPNHTGTQAIIQASVGAGGSLTKFNIIDGGSGYVSPVVSPPDPSYSNLSIVGVSKLSVGNTTQCGIGFSMTIQMGPNPNTPYFEVKDYQITKPGYNFELGDVFTLVGLVTDARLISPINPLEFTVTEIRTDNFASWQLGEFDYIDSIKNLQNGVRTRFPLYRNNQLLSFEKNIFDPTSSLIDFNSILLIYANGVMQEPNVSYTFDGGTTFSFIEPPRAEDNIAIFFYRGTKGVDSSQITVIPTLKPGDTVQIKKNDLLKNTVGQDPRVISFIVSSDLAETSIYLGDGIDDVNGKPLDLYKQKTDLIIDEAVQTKSRDSLESLVYPTAKIIKSLNANSTEIFVDDAQFFNYEQNNSVIATQYFSTLLVPKVPTTPANITANISNGSISSLNIIDGGSGYNYVGAGSSVLLKVRSVSGLGGTDAIMYASISSNGTVTTPVNIVNPGYGYSSTNPPQIIAPRPSESTELISNIKYVQGFSGIITGITTSAGIGTYLGITFYISYSQYSNVSDLLPGYPILVSDTTVGNGITSINLNDNQIVGIGTTFCDNIYYVGSILNNNLTGIITCNILSSTNTVGLKTSGNIEIGRFSWGRLSGFTRTNPISVSIDGYTVNSGLSTFPTMQRRKYGLRNSGALRKDLG